MNTATINMAIRQAMKERSFSLKMIADALNLERPNDVSARLASKNMTFDRAIEILNVLGYEVVVQPRRRGGRPEGQFVIAHSGSPMPKKGKRKKCDNQEEPDTEPCVASDTEPDSDQT